MMKIKWIVLVIFLLPNICLACSGGFKKGYGLPLIKLIDKTATIVLAKFVENKDLGIGFNIERVIKESNENTTNKELKKFHRIVSLSHIKFSKGHKSIDFDEHSDELFWANEKELQRDLVSRVLLKGGMCTPAFTFMDGEQYLIFASSPGSYYAAEIIKTENDKWFQYVINRVGSGE